MVNIAYEGEMLKIKAIDNGVGFDSTDKRFSAGIGLSNIQNRAQLIKAKAKIESKIGKGTEFTLIYKNAKS
jgi:signal transduction histidine kinase